MLQPFGRILHCPSAFLAEWKVQLCALLYFYLPQGNKSTQGSCCASNEAQALQYQSQAGSQTGVEGLSRHHVVFLAAQLEEGRSNASLIFGTRSQVPFHNLVLKYPPCLQLEKEQPYY